MFRTINARRLFASSPVSRNTLAFLEAANGNITASSLSAVTAASKLGKPITAILAGAQSESLVLPASRIEAIDHVILAKDVKYDHYLAEEMAPLLKEIIESRKFTHFITPASAVGKSFLPRLGALLDVQPISDVIEVVSEDTFIRPIYAGNALATIRSSDAIKLASIRASAFSPASATTESVTIEEIQKSTHAENRTKFLSEQLIDSDRPELGSAKKVVAGGRGLKNKETFDMLIEPLASRLNAAIGASRAAVDAGFCDNSLQVGQTGKIVAPELYIAIGISGAIQHLAGMKDSKTIVAINKDPEAPIFNIADLGLVSDLNEAVPALSSKM